MMNKLRCVVWVGLWLFLASTCVEAQPLGQPQRITVVDSGTACVTAPAACATFSIGTASSVAFQVSGTWTGTLTGECSSFSEPTFVSVLMTNAATGAQATTTTANGVFSFPNAGFSTCRLRATAAITGAAVVSGVRGFASRLPPASGGSGTFADLTVTGIASFTGTIGADVDFDSKNAADLGSVEVHAGASTDLLKGGGAYQQQPGNITDAGVQNQWNVNTVAIAANALSVNGNVLQIEVPWLTATNGNTKEYQLYFAPATATCSGSNAALCDAGCALRSTSSTASATAIAVRVTLFRTSSGNQKFWRYDTVGSTGLGTCTVTDTAATQIAFGVRNTSAAAASIVNSGYILTWFGGK